MPKPKHFSKDDGAFTGRNSSGEDWTRDYGEAGVYVQKADDGNWEIRENEYIPNVGTDDREIDVKPTKKKAMDVARDYVMNYEPRKGEADYDGKHYIYDFYTDRIVGGHSRDDLCEYVADYINRNYVIFTEYEDYESGEIEDAEGKLAAVGRGQIGLTTDRERGFLKKERFDKADFDLVYYMEQVLEEKGLLTWEVHRAIQRVKVQNDALPAEFRIEDEALDKTVQESANMVVSKMENPPHTRIMKTS